MPGEEQDMIVVTGATGQLGQLVIEALLERGTEPGSIVAAVSSPAKAEGLERRGVQVRRADLNEPESLVRAFSGADRVLLISSNAIGTRVVQHRAAIDAARAAGVRLLAYTSILNAGFATNLLAQDHRDTETYLRESGLPYTLLRNGWYTENHTGGLQGALKYGAIPGAGGQGRFASAARRDYAGAAAAVLTGQGHENKVYELGGEAPYTMDEFAAEVSRQAGKPVEYRDLPREAYAEALKGFGLSRIDAEAVADAEASRGELDTQSTDLATLLGRPSTPIAETIRLALAG